MNVRACGCIPYRHAQHDGIEVLMILKRGGFWEFPKGKQEKGETDEETALRELKEETGLTGEVTKDVPINCMYSFTRKEIRTKKTVCYFLCRVPDKAVVHIDKHEVNDYAWFSPSDLKDRATYPEMKEVADKARALLVD